MIKECFRKNIYQTNKAMTFIEMLIVVSLIALVSLALYNSLSNGIRVWERSRELLVEEDVAVFFDKLSQDLRNAYPYSKIKFSGDEFQFSFSTIVQTPADARSGLPEDEYVEQIGAVRYYYDVTKNSILKKEANYSQAINKKFGRERVLVSSIERFKFNYFYLTDTGEIASTEAFDVFPSSIEVEVYFVDKRGQRIMKKLIDIPVDG